MEKVLFFLWKVDKSIEDRFSKNPKTLGKIFAIISSMFAYMGPFFLKFSHITNIFSITYFRGLIVYFLSYFFYKHNSNRIPLTKNRRMISILMVRSMMTSSLTLLYFYGFNYLPINITAVIFQTASVFTYLFGIVFNGEKPTCVKTGCVLTAFVGIIFILNPNFLTTGFNLNEDGEEKTYLIAIMAILLSAIIKSLCNVLLKSLGANDPMINNLFLSVAFVCVSSGGYFITETLLTYSLNTFFCLSLVGISSFSYHTFSFKAILHEDASTVSVIEGLTILYSYLFDIFYFGVTVKLGAVFGSVVVVLSITGLSLSKNASDPPNDKNSNLIIEAK